LFPGPREVPSEITGALYLPVDRAGTSKVKLARELPAAGVDLDAHAALPSHGNRLDSLHRPVLLILRRPSGLRRKPAGALGCALARLKLGSAAQ
jgi:hypothetical protein